MALLVTLVTLLAFSAPPALGQPAKVPAKAPAKLPVAVQPGLTCTPWSWRLCKLVAPKVYQVMVDAEGGGGMQAPGHFQTGDFSLDMQIPAGNSGGVNFAWYLMDTISPTNKDPKHSEIDFEIYGNTTAGTVLLTTNVFANGMQNLAQYSTPWDASAELHTYGIRWNKQQIVWLLDGKVLRVLNYVAGQPWPRFAMKPMASVWATPWTALQADFTKGPVTALYGNYKAAGCPAVALTVSSAAPIQCAGPWNANLTPAELAVHKAFSDPLLIVNYGWDKA